MDNGWVPVPELNSDSGDDGGGHVSDGGFLSAFQAVVGFFGRPNSETVLFSGYPIDLGAPTFDEIDRAAARSGLHADRFESAPQKITDADLPALILCKDGRAFALLEKVGRNRFSSHNGEISKKELRSLDVEMILTFSAVYLNSSDRADVAGHKEYENKHWLRSSLAPFWKAYLNVALAAMFINMIAIATPIFVMNVYDRILPNEAISSLWVLAAGVSAALLFSLLLQKCRSAIIDYTGREADRKLAYTLFEKVLHSRLSHRPASTGEFASRLSQYEFVREFFTSNTISVLIDSVFVFVFLAVIYYLTGWIAAIPAIAFVLVVIVGLIAQHRIGKRVARAANEAAERHALLVESVATIETVKALRAESHLLRKWSFLTNNSSKTSEDIKQISSGAANTTAFIQQMVTVAIVVSGAYAFAAGEISTGAIIATVMLSSRAVAPLGQISMTLARIRQVMLSIRILSGIMEQPEDRPMSTGFVNREVNSGKVRLDDVEFMYPDTDNAVLSNVNIDIQAGERVGIIGKIGSGKTTLGKLLGGLFEPTSGRLLLDGIDVRQYHLHEVRKAVAFVGQASDLFTGTLKENLLIAKPDATDAEIIAAAQKAGVDEFASRHPRGFDMPVGERGDNLSGGQKQAVTIARLLMNQPKVVFLDEPSGAMDMASERRLIASLKKSFAPDTTLIISTHRYSLLEMVDRIIVIDNGRIVADGTKEVVLEDLAKRAKAAQSKATKQQTGTQLQSG
ncbi:MAG: type I secretion system permease/ATPase [Rhizobiaceae bacterium]|nr:type I secretion system permease/ATPase [Rhizobiaceae bacterium]